MANNPNFDFNFNSIRFGDGFLVLSKTNWIDAIQLKCETEELKNLSVDFQSFVPALLGALEDKEQIELILDANGELLIDNTFTVKTSSCSETKIAQENFYISFTLDEFKKLERDFHFSRHMMENTKPIDCVGFGFYEGKVNKYVISSRCYEIGEFEATINHSMIDHAFAFKKQVSLFPSNIWKLFVELEEQNIQFYFEDDRYIVSSEDLLVSVSASFGTNVFEKRMKMLTIPEDAPSFKLSLLDPIINTVKKYAKNLVEFVEDPEITLTTNLENNETTAWIDKTKMKFDIKLPFNFSVSSNFFADLNNKFDSDTDVYSLSFDDYSFIVFKTPNDMLFVKNLM